MPFLKGNIPWAKGRKFTQEHIDKIRKATLGNQNAKGCIRSKETKEKLRIQKLGKNNPMFGKYGKLHHRYIIDRSKIKTDKRNHGDAEYKLWRRNIMNRDNWKCKINNQNCSGNLVAHHILPWSKFPELRYNINNGISLCHSHHPRKLKDVKKLATIFQKMVTTNV